MMPPDDDDGISDDALALLDADLPKDRQEMVRAVFKMLRLLTDDERWAILCWFCHGCHRYVGPGDRCNCAE